MQKSNQEIIIYNSDDGKTKKAESLIINSVGQRPVMVGRFFHIVSCLFYVIFIVFNIF